MLIALINNQYLNNVFTIASSVITKKSKNNKYVWSLKRLVILGGTGSGKGTQTAKINDSFGIPSISTGEILRTGITTGSDLDRLAQSYVEKGELVPDELMIQFIKGRLLEPDVMKGWILEGYSRTALCAEELDFLLKQLKQKLNWAIYLKVSESVMAQRAKSRGLADDTSSVIIAIG